MLILVQVTRYEAKLVSQVTCNSRDLRKDRCMKKNHENISLNTYYLDGRNILFLDTFSCFNKSVLHVSFSPVENQNVTGREKWTSRMGTSLANSASALPLSYIQGLFIFETESP